MMIQLSVSGGYMKTLVATVTFTFALALNLAAVARPSSVLHFAGRFASAEIESLDASGCIDTRVDLFGRLAREPMYLRHRARSRAAQTLLLCSFTGKTIALTLRC